MTSYAKMSEDELIAAQVAASNARAAAGQKHLEEGLEIQAELDKRAQAARIERTLAAVDPTDRELVAARLAEEVKGG